MPPKQKDDPRFRFARINWILLIIGIAMIFAGYVIMTFNDITISPILLAVAYIVVIPLALLYHPKPK